ncbi:MAG: ATP-dependent DNA helicase RecG [Candidatus Paceibacterota bacterium]
MQRHDPIEQHFKLQELQKKALKKIGLKTIEDLLYHFPTRYGDTAEMKNIVDLIVGENAVIFGRVSGLKTGKAFIKKTPIAEGYIEDETGRIKAVWFHQPYIAKMIQEGALVRVEGKVSERKNILGLVNPKIETVGKLPIGVGDSLFGEDGEVHSLYPVYPESRGITSLWIYHAIQKILKSGILDNLSDAIPDYILKTYNLPSLTTALVWIHAPLKEDDALSARKRFAFEEVFLIQLQKKKDRLIWQKEPAFVIEKTSDEVQQFVKRFPFQATEAQQKAINSIMSDFKKGQAMSRLLEGDVGSGKTAVAATTAYSVITSRPKGQDFGHLQVAYMAPTEILAKQHFESFIQYFTYLNINIGLITGKECRKFPSKTNPKEWTNISRAQLLKWVENGEIPILIGTHALIQKSVKFKHLAYVIIDEQHRFGTAQRQKLAKKEKFNPHLLSMTATPIPRTLALTVYGDLDLTLLDQMPSGRKPIITEIVLPGERENTYERIKQELKAGRQLYVICPRIDEPDPAKEQAVIAKSVMEEAERLERDIFPEYKDRIGILHSKMSPDDKEYVMEEFKKGNIKILVATSVVEVGVNVPNATVIIIEGAERFGLAQLHQLRGRVIRSNDQAYCYVFADSKTQKTVERLKAFKNSSNGFELAEFDLKLRGPGELSGNKQWGISDIGMEALKNIKMVEAARAEAEYLLSQDETLTKYPLLNAKLTLRKQDELHLE